MCCAKTLSKIRSIGILASCLAVILLVSAFADELHNNVPYDPNIIPPAPAGRIDLPFDPNDYDFLIYVPTGSEDSIQEAMNYLDIPLDSEADVRGPDPNYGDVTAQDLATHDILIVGWNAQGDTSGLNAAILAEMFA